MQEPEAQQQVQMLRMDFTGYLQCEAEPQG